MCSGCGGARGWDSAGPEGGRCCRQWVLPEQRVRGCNWVFG